VDEDDADEGLPSRGSTRAARFLTAAGLHSYLVLIVGDAFLVYDPRGEELSVAAIRFTSTSTTGDWKCSAARRLDQGARGKLRRGRSGWPETRPGPRPQRVALCDLRAPSARLTMGAVEVACRIGARVSALDSTARRGAAHNDPRVPGKPTPGQACAHRFARRARANASRVVRARPPRSGGRNRAGADLPHSRSPQAPALSRHTAQDYPRVDRWYGSADVEILRRCSTG